MKKSKFTSTILISSILLGYVNCAEKKETTKTQKQRISPSSSSSSSKEEVEKLHTAPQSLFGYNSNGPYTTAGGGSFGGGSNSFGGGGPPGGLYANSLGTGSGGGGYSSGVGGAGGGIGGVGGGGAFSQGPGSFSSAGPPGGGYSYRPVVGGGGYSSGPGQFSSGTGGYSPSFSSGGGDGRFGFGGGQVGPGGFGNGFGGGYQSFGQANPFGFPGANSPYQGGYLGGGQFGAPVGFGGFGSSPGFGGFSPNIGFGGSQSQSQSDRNLGFVNQGFGNPLFNGGGPSSSSGAQPNLGSIQVGNRLDVNGGSNNRALNYIPGSRYASSSPTSSSPNQFSTLTSFNGFPRQNLPPYMPMVPVLPPSSYNSFGGPSASPFGFRSSSNNPFSSSPFDYQTRGSGSPSLRPGQGPSSSPPSSRNSIIGLGLGGGPSSPSSSGPNRFYQGTNPAGLFGRVHRFTSSDETDN